MVGSIDPTALRRARQRVGLTQTQVARALGLASDGAVSEWERGAFEPKTASMLHRLAGVLDVSVTDLLRQSHGRVDLRYLRLAAGLESADVADQLHVAVSTYLRWERGAWTRPPGGVVVEGLAKALRASPGQVSSAFTNTRANAERDLT